ncbi:hypothetical protein M514_04120, partial [Trichuris suis]
MLSCYFVLWLLSTAAATHRTDNTDNNVQKDLEVFLKSPNDYTEVSIEVRHTNDGKESTLYHTDLGDHLVTILCGLFGGILLLLLFVTVIWGCAMIHERERQTYISVP